MLQAVIILSHHTLFGTEGHNKHLSGKLGFGPYWPYVTPTLHEAQIKICNNF
jgi:hypothetical protein